MDVFSCDVMVDIECLGVAPDALILTIAAVAFDPISGNIHSDRSLYFRIDPESQPNRGIDQSTLEWWSTQPKIARDEAFDEKDRVPLRHALEKLSNLIWSSKRLWANGITYDITILEHAFKQESLNLPWQYYKVMDARTVYKLAPEVGKLSNNHHALYDTIAQVKLLHDALSYLKVKTLG